MVRGAGERADITYVWVLSAPLFPGRSAMLASVLFLDLSKISPLKTSPMRSFNVLIFTMFQQVPGQWSAILASSSDHSERVARELSLRYDFLLSRTLDSALAMAIKSLLF